MSNANEELKNNIINNLNNLKEKKLKKGKHKAGGSKPDNKNFNKPAKIDSKQRDGRFAKERVERPAPRNKFDKLDRGVLDKYNRFGSVSRARVEVMEEPEAEEEQMDYAEFLRAQREIHAGEVTHEIVGVRFKPVGKIYFFGPAGIGFKAGDKVIVETARGLEMGSIVFENRRVSEKQVVPPLKPILRAATDDDIRRVDRNRKAAAEAMKTAEERIKAHGLRMKLIDAEYTFDNSKLIYYFTHEGRVDFRELVKDLASIFKIRIELRQIGIRDQTKVLGGLSVCGRPFCCSSFLPDFEQVTIKMAKDQNISINSAKISGACGRLMCCLKYEHETYEQLNKDMPRQGAFVETGEGESGMVVESNSLTGMCRVRITRAPNQRADPSESAVKPYHKSQLKVTGYARRDSEPAEENLAGLDVVVEHDPVKSGIDIEV